MTTTDVIAPPRAEARTVHLAPFGRHTRYMLGRYLVHVALVTSVLLAIALTIDLWPQFEQVASSGGGGALAAAWSVIRFCLLRAPWLIAPFLPFATYLGVFWTEATHTSSGERMLAWNSGRSPAQCLAPVVLLGLILGAGEFVLDAYVGPASMAVQMEERLGLDGRRLDRSRIGAPAWISLPDGLLRAEIEYGPPPVLHRLTWFGRDAGGRLIAAYTAEIARRKPGTNDWVMENGRWWKPGQTPSTEATDALALVGATNETMIAFRTRTATLDLDPLWLSVYGMEPQYVPMHVLRPLARSHRLTDWTNRYRTRLNVLYGETILPGAMALLAASLSMLLLAYGTSFRALVVIAFAGYMAHFATKACLLLGQTGYMSPVLAGWLVPGVLLLATAGVLAVAHRRRRASRKFSDA